MNGDYKPVCSKAKVTREAPGPGLCVFHLCSSLLSGSRCVLWLFEYQPTTKAKSSSKLQPQVVLWCLNLKLIPVMSKPCLWIQSPGLRDHFCTPQPWDRVQESHLAVWWSQAGTCQWLSTFANSKGIQESRHTCLDWRGRSLADSWFTNVWSGWLFHLARTRLKMLPARLKLISWRPTKPTPAMALWPYSIHLF